MSLKDLRTKARPDLIFFIIGFLVFPAVIIVSVYSIFKVKDDTPVVSFPLDNLSVSIQEVDKKDLEENINKSEPMTSSTNTVRTGHSQDGLNKSIANQQSIEKSGEWSATQYSKGDIVKNTYVVQLGDTLWQIANAYYGDGSRWTEILSKNSNSIGFLANGEQALIVVNQVLELP